MLWQASCTFKVRWRTLKNWFRYAVLSLVRLKCFDVTRLAGFLDGGVKTVLLAVDRNKNSGDGVLFIRVIGRRL